MKDSVSKPRILIVLPTHTLGGAERVTYNMIQGLNSFDVALLTQQSMFPFFSPLGIALHGFEDYGCRATDITLKTILNYARAIRLVSGQIRPSVIFGVMHFASFFATLAKDLSFSAIPVVASIHGTYSSHFQSVKRSLTLYESVLIRYFLRRSKYIIVPSEGIRSDLLSHFPIDGSTVHVIYNGFDLDWIRKSASEDIPLIKDRPWIVTASRLGPPKDFETLIRAFVLIRQRAAARLLIIGDGPYRERIVQSIAESGLNEDVILTGFQDNPFKYISRGDLFVLSSLSEGLPSALIEALALGVPVVSTDCPSGPSEIITHGVNGLLTPPGDADSLATACLTLLNDVDLRSRLSASGMARADSFSMVRMQRAYEGFFKKLIYGEAGGQPCLQ